MGLSTLIVKLNCCSPGGSAGSLHGSNQILAEKGEYGQYQAVLHMKYEQGQDRCECEGPIAVRASQF